MNMLTCEKCKKELVFGKDSDPEGEVTSLAVVCPCGHRTYYSFLGYPTLYSTGYYYFEFTDENEITCKLL